MSNFKFEGIKNLSEFLNGLLNKTANANLKNPDLVKELFCFGEKGSDSLMQTIESAEINIISKIYDHEEKSVYSILGDYKNIIDNLFYQSNQIINAIKLLP